jgi:hypothetical protein
MRVTKQNHRTRKAGAVQDNVRAVPTPGLAAKLSSNLHLSNRSTLAEMRPGDIVFLDEVSAGRESSAPVFIAVLACPWCGSPGLIAAAQFSGAASIVCTSKNCSGLFRIINEAQIVPIPPI